MTPFGLFDTILFGVVALVAVSVIVFTRINSVPPPNAPAAYGAARPEGRLSRGGRPLAVLAGDSITRGAVSVSYEEMLALRLPDWDFVNAGVNNELAYNLAARLDEIVALDPDAVTILIGTNDVYSTCGFSSALGYIATERLPERPSPLFYRENLTAIVRRLTRETRARVAIFSIPPIGEEPGHYAYLRTEEYARIAASVAKEEGVEYLPLRERMCAYLDALPKRAGGPLPFRRFPLAVIRSHNARNYLGRSFDEISAANGFNLLVDGIHLNTHGASMVADLAEDFLRRVTAPRDPA